MTQAREELQKGTALTRQGRFNEAIPHLLAAQKILQNEYALQFNLSLCYVGVGDYSRAISALDGLRRRGHDNANVENLLAQAYVGNGQDAEALAAVERAASISPQDEKLFTFVADACMDRQDFEFGLKVIDLGLAKFPQSARLHYARAMLLSELDQLDRAKEDFARASKLGQGSEVGYLAAAQQKMFEGSINDAIQIAREGMNNGIEDSALLEILGKALLRSGVMPGQTEFNEAQSALEKSVSEHPNDAGAQIALAQVYLQAGRFDDAIAHLDVAQRMRPNQPSIYASLAKAYQRKGDSQRAQEALQKLEALNQTQAERIRSAPGERKMSYGGSSPAPQ
ncbi:MAG TPA: tetratricopeptide repeat protein [Candidatus Sulfotelmatobacter sp.]|nr:tetratricopeptide repeat protein [Candidatus Sulfotelmatobacter sp.]